jgi:hypothetical protein
MAEPEVFYTYDNYNNDPDVLKNFNTTLKDILSRDLGNGVSDDPFDKYVKQLKEASCNQIKTTEKPKLLAQQKFIPEYINEKTPYRGLLVWHGLGSGKSCTAISVSNHFKKDKVVIVPAALVDNFVGDYKICGKDPDNEPFVTFSELKKKSVQKPFTTYTSNGNINEFTELDAIHFEDKLIIIDESQLTISHITNAIKSRIQERVK